MVSPKLGADGGDGVDFDGDLYGRRFGDGLCAIERKLIMIIRGRST